MYIYIYICIEKYIDVDIHYIHIYIYMILLLTGRVGGFESSGFRIWPGFGLKPVKGQRLGLRIHRG